MAQEISEAWGPRPMTIVGVLTGCVIFLADLIRRLDMPLRVELIQASSYRGQTVRGALTLGAELQPDVAGCDVLLVDDIYDTGHTLVEVLVALQKQRPASIRTAVLFRKEGRQEVDYKPDFVGFRIPNQFVVGYGLDYLNEFRNLPYLAILEADDMRDLPASLGAAER